MAETEIAVETITPAADEDEADQPTGKIRGEELLRRTSALEGEVPIMALTDVTSLHISRLVMEAESIKMGSAYRMTCTLRAGMVLAQEVRFRGEMKTILPGEFLAIVTPLVNMLTKAVSGCTAEGCSAKRAK